MATENDGDYRLYITDVSPGVALISDTPPGEAGYIKMVGLHEGSDDEAAKRARELADTFGVGVIALTTPSNPQSESHWYWHSQHGPADCCPDESAEAA